MKAWELLDRPEKWIKGRYAAYSDNELTLCYCAKGALMTAYAGRTDDYLSAARKLEHRLGNKAIEPWNDHPDRTYEQVIGLLKELDI